MKVQELYRQVAALGFEDSLESSARNRFYYTANRALLQISAVRPVIKSLILKHRPLTNLLVNSNDEREVSGTLEFTANGAKAYYFEFEGSGTASLAYYDGQEWRAIGTFITLEYGSEYIKKGIIKGDVGFVDAPVRITFESNGYILRVKNVALYGEIYSDNVELIPNNENYTRYDIGSLVDDFNGLHVPLMRDDGSFIKVGDGYTVENNRIVLVARENTGVFRALYKHKPKAISFSADPQNNADDIDLDDDLVSLMPLLMASYLWLDEAPDKAQYYLSLYREGVNAIKSDIHDVSPVNIVTNGWA